jgi:hypothetical protein
MGYGQTKIGNPSHYEIAQEFFHPYIDDIMYAIQLFIFDKVANLITHWSFLAAQ